MFGEDPGCAENWTYMDEVFLTNGVQVYQRYTVASKLVDFWFSLSRYAPDPAYRPTCHITVAEPSHSPLFLLLIYENCTVKQSLTASYYITAT